jgi:ATP-dependent protease ClpP protease subunit
MSKKEKDPVVIDTPVGTKKAARQYVYELEVAQLEYEVAQAELEVREAMRADEIAALSHNTAVHHEPYNGTFRLYGEVDATSMERLRISTARYAAAYPKEPITLILSSPGGSVFDGWVLFDHLRALSADGHKITTVVRGVAGSMAAVLTQAGDVRVIGPESYLVIHEPSSMAWGTTSSMIDEVEMMKVLRGQMERVFTKRSRLTTKVIKDKTAKRDWYVGAKECKALGLADKIA